VEIRLLFCFRGLLSSFPFRANVPQGFCHSTTSFAKDAVPTITQKFYLSIGETLLCIFWSVI
jgi:hypothetical protein